MQITGASIEILDLRHFAAPVLRPVLEAEGELWKQRLHWDYRASARLLMQYLDNHMLPGYAALEAGQVNGYVFCVYEETKAVIGDVFALPGHARWRWRTDRLGLRHGRSAAPASFRTAAQLAARRSHRVATASASIRVPIPMPFAPPDSGSFARLFLVQALEGRWNAPQADLPGNLELRPWRDEDLAPAARLICEAYRGHPDSLINDQYRSVHGSMRFLNNIVRYAGCGSFLPQVSHVVVERASRELVALVLGSRVSPQSGHMTQVCVHPAYRRRGLARMLLALAAFSFMRLGVSRNLAHRDGSQLRGHRSVSGRGLPARAQLRCGGVAAGSDPLNALIGLRANVPNQVMARCSTPRLTVSMRARLNAGMSSGLRLVMN